MDMNLSRVVIQSMEPWPGPEGYPIRSFEGRRWRCTVELFSPEGEVVAGRLLFRPLGGGDWGQVPLAAIGGDRFEGHIVWPAPGLYELTIEAWVDRVGSWKARFAAATTAERQGELLGELARLAAEASGESAEEDREQLAEFAAFLESDESLRLKSALVQDPELEALLRRYLPGEGVTRVEPSASVLVCSQRVAESAWVALELPPPGEVPAVVRWREELGRWRRNSFTGVILPALQPLAEQRLGNAEASAHGILESVRAVGGAGGQHTDLGPRIGNWEEWGEFVEVAREQGLRLALEIPLACSPQHPWLREHPEWFLRRSDGAVVAEGDPVRPGQAALRYDFAEGGEPLVSELARVVRSWIERGIEVFHFTTPEKAPSGFWENLLESLRREHPGVEFCAAWDGPANRRRRLAAAGFQWARSAAPGPWDRIAWTAFGTPGDGTLPFAMLAGGGAEDGDGEPALRRLWLALTAAFLPVFSVPESWLADEASLSAPSADASPGATAPHWLPRLLDLRRREPAFWAGSRAEWLETDSAALWAVLRTPPPDVEGAHSFVIVVDLDPRRTQTGWFALPEELGTPEVTPWQVREEIAGCEFLWFERVQEVRIAPEESPLAVFRLPELPEM